MMKNHLYGSALVLLALLSPGDTQTGSQCGVGQVLTSQGCVCLHCPHGQEPSQRCGQAVRAAGVLRCRACPAGTFSDGHSPDPCRPHRSCAALNRVIVILGRAHSNTICGPCLHGFSSPAGEMVPGSEACVRLSVDPLVRAARSVGKSSPHDLEAVNATNIRGQEEKATEYAVFALVPIFCITGLLGIFICNTLKKKGYRCTGDKEGGDVEEATPQKEANTSPFIVDDPNEDTINILVRLITEKKENATALEELLLEYESRQMAISKATSIKLPALPTLAHYRSLPRLCPHQRHPHTINGLALHSGTFGCSRCSQKKWPELLLKPPTNDHEPAREHNDVAGRTAKAPLPSDVTILSVGRFQVAQIAEQNPSGPETSDTESMESAQTEPAEESSLLAVSCSSSTTSWTKGKQEESC